MLLLLLEDGKNKNPRGQSLLFAPPFFFFSSWVGELSNRNSSSGGTPRRFRPIAPKGDSPRLSAGPGKSSPGNGTSSGKRKPCNCKQSRCLKLYCECFASGVYCEDCNCVNCHNNPQHEEERQEAVNATLERDSNAFRNKITIAQRNQVT